MKNSENVIRVVASSLAAFVGALFAAGYNDCLHHKAEHFNTALPSLTECVVALIPWAFVVPILVIGLGISFRKREALLAVIASTGWLFGLTWPLLCIFAWEMPWVPL